MSGRSLIAIVVVASLVGGGSATAAKLITGRQIKDGSITSRDIQNDTLTYADVSGSLVEDISYAIGPGPTGPPGPTGIASILTVTQRVELCGGTTDCSIGVASVQCPAGTRPVSGGGVAISLNGLFLSTAAGSGGQATGWSAGGDNYGSAAGGYVDVYAYCSSGVQSFFGGGGVRSTSDTRALAATKRAGYPKNPPDGAPAPEPLPPLK